MHKASLVLLLVGGCVVHERVPPNYPPPEAPPPPASQPAPPPPSVPPPPASTPAPSAVEERRAVKAATDFVRAKGLSVERYKAQLDQHGNWRIDLRSDHDGDRAKVLVDGRSGRVLRAKVHDAGGWDD